MAREIYRQHYNLPTNPNRSNTFYSIRNAPVKRIMASFVAAEVNVFLCFGKKFVCKLKSCHLFCVRDARLCRGPLEQGVSCCINMAKQNICVRSIVYFKRPDKVKFDSFLIILRTKCQVTLFGATARESSTIGCCSTAKLLICTFAANKWTVWKQQSPRSGPLWPRGDELCSVRATSCHTKRYRLVKSSRSLVVWAISIHLIVRLRHQVITICCSQWQMDFAVEKFTPSEMATS